jgi:D-glycero-D-manno-heptose 1,7-bisphosphate phosphatase
MGVDTLKRAVFFDRDGVLNVSPLRAGKPHPPSRIGELQMHEGASESVRLVIEAGFVPVIVTNQPDVARGIVTGETVDAINREVANRTGIAAVYTCCHDDADACACRKPGPGLLLRAASDLELDLSRSYLVGDRLKDVQAGRAAGCATIFIDLHYPETPKEVGADVRASSLREAVTCILERERCAVS